MGIIVPKVVKARVIFILIFLLAAFFRLFNLPNNPPSLNWDEVSIGYNAYSVLKTGRDEWGELFPLSFRAYGDYKLPGYIYLDTPFIALFGLNGWGVRLPSALLGIGIVVIVFLILKKVTGNLLLSLLGMLTAGVLPWLVILSRIALEANLALFLTTLSFYFLLLGLEKNRYLIFATFALGLSLFSYNSSRVVALPLILLAVILFKKEFKVKKQTLTALGIFISLFLVTLPLIFLQDSSARYRWTQILDEGAIANIENLRGSTTLHPVLTRLAYNKITYFIPRAFTNYISHFNPGFLILNGGSHYQYSVPGSGLIFAAMLPFLVLGFWAAWKQRLNWQLFVVGWLLVAPLPAAITRDAPHALRSLFLTVPIIIMAILGIDYLIRTVSRKISAVIVGITIVAMLSNFYLFWKNYSGDYIKKYSWSWQYGYQQAIDFINRQPQKYGKIIFTKKYGEAHEFILFYNNVDPQSFREDPSLVRYNKSDWYWVDRFDKYEFINDWEVGTKAECGVDDGRCLLVTSPGNSPDGWKLVETVDFLDTKPAFDILENN